MGSSPREDQAYNPPVKGLPPPGGNAGTLRARQVIIIGTGGLVLVYSPTAGPGNLIASIAANNSTDLYGNHYLRGVTNYSPGTPITVAARLFNGQLNFQYAPAIPPATVLGPWTDPTVGYTLQQLAGPVYAPQIISASGVLSLGGSPMGVTQALVGQNPISGAADTWHSLGTLAGYTVVVASYRMSSAFKLELDIVVTAGGANAVATTFSVTLPAAYIPVTTQRELPAASSHNFAAGETQARVVVDTAGGVTLQFPANQTSTVYCCGEIPLT